MDEASKIEDQLNVAAELGGPDVVKDATKGAMKTEAGQQVVEKLLTEEDSKLSPDAATGVVEGAAEATRPDESAV